MIRKVTFLSDTTTLLKKDFVFCGKGVCHLNHEELIQGYLKQTWNEKVLCWNTLDKRGVILGKTESHQNLLAVFFRPVGFNPAIENSP